MEFLKSIARQIPGMRGLYRFLRGSRTPQPRPVDLKSRFETIYHGREWGGDESASGPGSDTVHTRLLIDELPKLLRKHHVTSFVDVPCGDFNWMKAVDLDGIQYVGGDIVTKLIERNSSQFGSGARRFCEIDLTSTPLPRVDLVFCRDCLVHLSFADIAKALKNICRSEAKYLLTTSFPEKGPNYDIASGDWRALNLELSPFQFPKPSESLVENYTGAEGKFLDKSLCLWEIAAIRPIVESLPERPAC